LFPAVESCSIGISKPVAIVTDSARCNVSARAILSKELPGVTKVACYAHQLNLLAGEVITHDTVKSVARTGAEIVSFFNGSNKYLSIVREIRKSEYGRAKSLCLDARLAGTLTMGYFEAFGRWKWLLESCLTALSRRWCIWIISR
jgi:hypothetical protein